MEKRPTFRHPNEMEVEEAREPVSARVKKSTKQILTRAAKDRGLSVALLIGKVLDDYADFLRSADGPGSRSSKK